MEHIPVFSPACPDFAVHAPARPALNKKLATPFGIGFFGNVSYKVAVGELGRWIELIKRFLAVVH